MPGLVKVGYTTGSVESRLNQLNGTGVPTSFDIAAQFYVRAPKQVEKQLHVELDSLRLNGHREFFSGHAQEILERCIPIILASMSNGEEKAKNPPNARAGELPDGEEKLLVILVNEREIGCSMFDLEYRCQMDVHSLVMERDLESLRSNGYVEFRRARGNRGSDRWRITSKGIKLLFDTGALQEEQLEQRAKQFDL